MFVLSMKTGPLWVSEFQGAVSGRFFKIFQSGKRLLGFLLNFFFLFLIKKKILKRPENI